MNHFQEALADRRSTVLYGPFGRYPNLVEFYLNAIPDLEPASDYEPVFWYRKKHLLHVVVEPAFDEAIPSHRWNLVLTSHLRLRYDPLRTRVIDAHFPLERQIPFPEKATADQTVVVPPTSHRRFDAPFLNEPSRIDLSAVDDPHEGYLRLLTLYDRLRPFSEWSLSVPEKLRLELSKAIPGTGPYDSHLLGALAH